LHIIDASDPERHEKTAQVNLVLKQINADLVPQIEVYNKIDLLDNMAPCVERDECGQIWRVWLSAVSGKGMELLRLAIAERLATEQVRMEIRIPSTEGRLRALLYDWGAVVEEKIEDCGAWLLAIRIDAKYRTLLHKQDGFKNIEILVDASESSAAVTELCKEQHLCNHSMVGSYKT